MAISVLIVDDEENFLDSVKRALKIAGFKNIKAEADSTKVPAIIEQGYSPDIALIDINMPVIDGITLLTIIKDFSPATECIMITAINEARHAVECLKKGAYDYLTKPLSNEYLIFTIKRALERKRLLGILDINKQKTVKKIQNKEAFKDIITKSPQMIRVMQEAELHAESDVPILITGESGTGKDLLAKAIHLASSRSQGPFVPVNMASFSNTLFEGEFFGHTKGAFTGANDYRKGYLEHANGGTLFLDEIGNLSVDLQAKLLRVLQEGEYYKLGSSSPQRVNIRFIAATNEDLNKLMEKGTFRKDLYYRLRGAWLVLPPLRKRREDIPLLINKFIKESSGTNKKTEISKEALLILCNYDYPGNIRELKSIIQSAINLARKGCITPEFLPSYLQKTPPKFIPEIQNKKIATLSEVVRSHILRVYKLTNRNKTQTAKLLGIGFNTLLRKLRLYGIK